MKSRPPWFYKQAGVIPYRRPRSELEILLVTSRGGGHWIIPKGIIDPGETPIQSACKEAYEEAGVEGRADRRRIGQYEYQKWGGTCLVQVFAFDVTNTLESWPEAEVRQRKWFSRKEAVKAVKDSALKELIRTFSPP